MFLGRLTLIHTFEFKILQSLDNIIISLALGLKMIHNELIVPDTERVFDVFLPRSCIVTYLQGRQLPKTTSEQKHIIWQLLNVYSLAKSSKAKVIFR